jgi:hypothetical protein
MNLQETHLKSIDVFYISNHFLNTNPIDRVTFEYKPWWLYP